MGVKTINAQMLQKMFLAGARGLEAKKEYINELNVFPVPDGDTGTNMTMTIMSAAGEVSALTNPSMDQLGKAISSGSLRGARGNSGVILSQIFRGFVKEIKGLDEIDVTVLGNGINHAAETAYKAVMKPKEGTILTVAKAEWDMIDRYFDFVKANGYFDRKRSEQARYWMYETIDAQLRSNFYNNPEIERMLAEKEVKVLNNQLSSFVAARDVLNHYFRPENYI